MNKSAQVPNEIYIFSCILLSKDFFPLPTESLFRRKLSKVELVVIFLIVYSFCLGLNFQIFKFLSAFVNPIL